LVDKLASLHGQEGFNPLLIHLYLRPQNSPPTFSLPGGRNFS